MDSCNSAETLGTQILIIPHTVANSLNLATVQTVNGLITTTATGLSTAMEGLVQLGIWMIRMYTKTLRCVLELVMNGSLAALEDATRLVQNLLHETARVISAHTDTLAKGVNSAKSAIPFMSGLIPDITIPPLDGVPIPNLVAGVQELSKHLPTFKDLEARLVALITDPVRRISKSVETTVKSNQLDFAALPLPDKGEVSFCADADLSSVDFVAGNALRVAWWLAGVTVLLIIFIVFSNMVLIRYHHWKQDRRFARVAAMEDIIRHEDDQDYHPRRRANEHHHIYLQPTFNRFAITTSRKLFRTRSNRTLWRWFLDYVLYRPALVCAAVGSIGIIAIVLQQSAINSFRNHQPVMAKAVQELGYTAGTSVNDQFGALTQDFLTSTNEILADKEDDFNRKVFDSAKEIGSVLEETLSTAIDGIAAAVDTLLGSSQMAQPAKKFVDCLIMSRLRSMQRAIEWVQANSRLSIPRVPETALKADEASIVGLTERMSVEMFGDSLPDNDGGYVGRALDSYENSLHKETCLYAILLGGYVVLVMLGVLRVIIEKRRENKH